MVHLLVLEDGEDRLAPIEQGMPGPFEVGMFQRVDDAPVRLCGTCRDDVTRRPSVVVARCLRPGSRRGPS